jgi:hypothetical protein
MQGMQRAVLITLTVLASSILLTATGQAQPRNGATRSGGGRAVVPRAAGGPTGSTSHSGVRDIHGGSHDHSRNHNLSNGSLFYPVGYEGAQDGEEPGPPEDSGPAPMMAPGGHPRRIPTGPKITELPATTKAANSAPSQPAMFILTSGERIETRQYLVAFDHVELTVDRQSRSLPLSALDVNATLEADRKRGIDLRIPAGHNEISLGF